MHINEFIRTPVGADYALSRNNPAIRRARFIAASADVSASLAFRSPDEQVNMAYLARTRKMQREGVYHQD